MKTIAELSTMTIAQLCAEIDPLTEVREWAWARAKGGAMMWIRDGVPVVVVDDLNRTGLDALYGVLHEMLHCSRALEGEAFYQGDLWHRCPIESQAEEVLVHSQTIQALAMFPDFADYAEALALISLVAVVSYLNPQLLQMSYLGLAAMGLPIPAEHEPFVQEVKALLDWEQVSREAQSTRDFTNAWFAGEVTGLCPEMLPVLAVSGAFDQVIAQSVAGDPDSAAKSVACLLDLLETSAQAGVSFDYIRLLSQAPGL